MAFIFFPVINGIGDGASRRPRAPVPPTEYSFPAGVELHRAPSLEGGASWCGVGHATSGGAPLWMWLQVTGQRAPLRSLELQAPPSKQADVAKEKREKRKREEEIRGNLVNMKTLI